MKLIGCDRCGGVFPSEERHARISIVGVVAGGVDGEAPEIHKDLCLGCRVILDEFLMGADDVAGAGVASGAIKPGFRNNIRPNATAGKRKSPTWSTERTCEICGRVGVQRFVQTETGWKCSTSARSCPGNHPGVAVEAPVKAVQVDVAPADPEPEPEAEPVHHAPAPPAPGVTARCQDCTRTWTLTGIVLTQAAQMHELKHGHIVDILEIAESFGATS